MGLIICEKHGRQAIQLVCAEIRSNVVSAIPITDYKEIVDLEIPEISHFLCSACFTKYGSRAFDDEETPLWPVCGACFSELL
jgi:hypothetical protein